jgi:hypothetical protein
MSSLICVEKRTHPDAGAAKTAVRDLWKDRPTSIVAETAQEWFVRVDAGWPMTPCPDAGADAMVARLFGVTSATAHTFHTSEQWRSDCLYVFSLAHCWALWGWSRALPDLATEPITVIHLDAHADLQTPALVCTEDPTRFSAPAGPWVLDLGDPVSIEDMIERGFVGIGGFLAPLLYANRECDLIHVEPQVGAPEGARLAFLNPCQVPHRTLAGVHNRPTARCQGSSGQVYLCTDNLTDLERLDLRRTVLLDIDMDYFCNRFEETTNGSSSLAGEDDCWPRIEDSIGRLGDILTAVSWRHQVRAVSVALSPGFFPSEYWEASVAKLKDVLSACYRDGVTRA